MVEVLIAIAILTVAVAAPLFLASKGLSAAFVSRDQITAFYLALESIEHIRYTRDTNILKSPPDPWLNGLLGLPGCGTATGCKTEYVVGAGISITDCVAVCPPLEFDDLSGYVLYNYSGPGSNSIYTRSVRVIQPRGINEADIISTVSWQAGTIQKSVTIEATIFNWLP